MAREFAKKFYHSKEWLKTRDIVFERDKGLCQKCLRDKGEAVPGEEVHHKIWLRPSNINNPDITLNIDNLELLCKDCHIGIHKSAAHKKEHHKMICNNGVYIGEDGDMHKQKVYIVHGAPGSGKSTFVQDNMQPGDLVVDLDLIKQSLCMSCNKETPDNLYAIAESIREMLYGMIERKEVNAKAIWVIALLPTRQQRKALASRLEAELIHVDEDIETCIERILKDDARPDKEEQMKIIDQYFGYYEPPPIKYHV